MVDFNNVVDEQEMGLAYNPYAGHTSNGEWIAGTISIDFLNANFSQYSTSAEMIAATSSVGLQLYFQWLKDQGKLN